MFRLEQQEHSGCQIDDREKHWLKFLNSLERVESLWGFNVKQGLWEGLCNTVFERQGNNFHPWLRINRKYGWIFMSNYLDEWINKEVGGWMDRVWNVTTDGLTRSSSPVQSGLAWIHRTEEKSIHERGDISRRTAVTNRIQFRKIYTEKEKTEKKLIRKKAD